MKTWRRLRVNTWSVFISISLLAALGFFLLDFFSPYFNGDGLYLSFLPDHIFLAELFGLAAATLYAFKVKEQRFRPWLISCVLTLLFIGFSYWNYYARYNIQITDSYRPDVSYTCIYGEMYSGTLDRTNLCVLREMPHEDVDFLVHLRLVKFNNIGTFDIGEFMVFILTQFVVLGSPLYALVTTQLRKRHLS